MIVPPMILNMRVRRCALELEDTAQLAKLAPGDMIALETKYYWKGLPKLYNRTRAADSSGAGLDVPISMALHLQSWWLTWKTSAWKNESSQSSSYLILHTCTRFIWHSWVLILKVTSTLPDLKSEHYLCSLTSGPTGKWWTSHIPWWYWWCS